MLLIKISENFSQERKYVIDTLFGEFLGLTYDLDISEKNDVLIKVSKDHQIIIRDAFFSQFQNPGDYLNIGHIPKKIKFSKNQFTSDTDIPVIYGSDNVHIKEKEIDCHIDLFASSFFMLTRWEEHVKPDRDNHNRFPATASLAYQNNFLKRPVVNEYAEMLWNMLKHLGFEGARKERNYQLIMTHDVDKIQLWNDGIKGLVSAMKSEMLTRKNISLGLGYALSFLKTKSGIGKDPYDTFDYMMDISEKHGIKSHFYFMSGGTSEVDNRYQIKDKKIKRIKEKIQHRGHVIGFHPSYNAYNDERQWAHEKQMLEEALGTSVAEGRHHYLRFETPKTWQIWENNKMQKDSTMGYPDSIGFRCGTCYEFNIFNFLTRSQLNLKERPLIAMEATLVNYQGSSYENAIQEVSQLKECVKKYNGNFVFLWHNSSFFSYPWNLFESLYEKVYL